MYDDARARLCNFTDVLQLVFQGYFWHMFLEHFLPLKGTLQELNHLLDRPELVYSTRRINFTSKLQVDGPQRQRFTFSGSFHEDV